jgi:hypothetical protein
MNMPIANETRRQAAELSFPLVFANMRHATK